MPDEYRLASLPVDTGEGKQYLNWTQLPIDFVKESREKMMLAAKAIMEKRTGKYTEFSLEPSHDINRHCNYAFFENHYGKDVWAHGKGAASAQNGELAVIPGAMGFLQLCGHGKGKSGEFLFFIPWSRPAAFEKRRYGGIFL